jgi:hypothetical protein
METSHSDVGYPEEQPDDVHDETTEPDRQRKRGEGDKPDREDDPGKTTGNPRN